MQKNKRRAFSLPEVLLAVVILLTGLLSVLESMNYSLRALLRSEQWWRDFTLVEGAARSHLASQGVNARDNWDNIDSAPSLVDSELPLYYRSGYVTGDSDQGPVFGCYVFSYSTEPPADPRAPILFLFHPIR